MRFVSNHHAGQARVFAGFGNPLPGDLLSFRLDTRSGRGEALLHCDVGLPVRQPTRISIAIQDVLLVQLREWAEDPALICQAAEAIALAAYVEASGRSLCTEPAAPRDGVRLLSELSDRGSRSQRPDLPPDPEALHLPTELAAFAAAPEGSVFRNLGGRLRPSEQLSPRVDHAISALESPRQTARICAELDRPAPSVALSLEAAGRALVAVPWPSAAAVCYFGDSDHRCHGWRMQAAASYPLLAARIAESTRWREAVDRGAPLADMICAETGLTERGSSGWRCRPRRRRRIGYSRRLQPSKATMPSAWSAAVATASAANSPLTEPSASIARSMPACCPAATPIGGIWPIWLRPAPCRCAPPSTCPRPKRSAHRRATGRGSGRRWRPPPISRSLPSTGTAWP